MSLHIVYLCDEPECYEFAHGYEGLDGVDHDIVDGWQTFGGDYCPAHIKPRGEMTEAENKLVELMKNIYGPTIVGHLEDSMKFSRIVGARGENEEL